MSHYKSIAVCLDMAGCPNRCKHCWLGHSPNGSLSRADLRFTADAFRPHTDKLTVYDWYREPDFCADYRERRELCIQLSDEPPEHFELISVWRMAHDESYAPWLVSLGVRAAQLTIFGGRETTDFFTGRRGAYDDILRCIDTLLDHGIAPRLQFFVNRRNIGELPLAEKLIEDLKLEERCGSIGKEFAFFLHAGSCDGENERFYPDRITADDFERIPKRLAELTLRHFGASDLSGVFGKPERELYAELCDDSSTADLRSDEPVFYVDSNFDVYPNFSAAEKHWCLGNLKADGVEKVLETYDANGSIAQNVRASIPLAELARANGSPTSERLFGRDDYITYLLNRYCRIS